MSIADPSQVSHDRQTRVTHTFRVKDAELTADVTKQYAKSTTFAPRFIVAEVVDGTVTMVRTSGPRRNKSGLGVSVREDYYAWRSVPDVIKQFLAPRIPAAIPAVKR